MVLYFCSKTIGWTDENNLVHMSVSGLIMYCKYSILFFAQINKPKIVCGRSFVGFVNCFLAYILYNNQKIYE